ncbi:MAG: 1-deoxy-D-xylulose-5-phosphate synthase [Deltaproteobacteria bacterium]|nr:1-deoxy-D-xylulose-5-phosphate synthase [Deltaproteobacteria bacterium]
MTGLLERIQSPLDVRALSREELPLLAREIRDMILEVVSKTGGHLASSLGVVELTLALHRVFNTPVDKIVWDVGHQSYAHKILTGRREQFNTLRQWGGISGFPKRDESEYDCFDVGHSGTSIAAALGMAVARDCRGGKEKIVAVIGDGALSGGLALEGLNQAGNQGRDLIVVLNDNEMSISPNVGAISSFLSRKLTSRFVVRLKKEGENFLRTIPVIGKDLLNLARRTENSLKGFLTPGMFFEALGFNYVGLLDGHNLDELLDTFSNVARMNGPMLVHVATRKGCGYPPAEENPSLFHGVGPFDLKTGQVKSGKAGATAAGPPTYTSVFGRTLIQQAQRDDRVVAITAAMADGTGLTEFQKVFPKRFFDVGIAEQQAVTFAAGMASQGMRPVVAIYSTFLQRAYDNLMQDVCLQRLPVTFALDRGGLVGADGPTHHGVFDLSYLRSMPDMVVMAPRDEAQLQRALVTALQHDGPFAFRYPRGQALGVPLSDDPEVLEIGRGELLVDGKDAVIFAAGSTVAAALEAAAQLKGKIDLAVVDVRFVKPLDEELVLKMARACSRVVTLEENSVLGGVGGAILELLARDGALVPTLCLGVPDRFIPQGTQAQLRALCGLDAAGVVASIQRWLH